MLELDASLLLSSLLSLISSVSGASLMLPRRRQRGLPPLLPLLLLSILGGDRG